MAGEEMRKSIEEEIKKGKQAEVKKKAQELVKAINDANAIVKAKEAELEQLFEDNADVLNK